MLEGANETPSLLKVMLWLFPSCTGIFVKNGGQKSARVRNHLLSPWKQRQRRNPERIENCFVFPSGGLGGGEGGGFLRYISLVFPIWCQPQARRGAIWLGAGRQGERHASQIVVSRAEFSESHTPPPPPFPVLAVLLRRTSTNCLIARGDT